MTALRAALPALCLALLSACGQTAATPSLNASASVKPSQPASRPAALDPLVRIKASDNALNNSSGIFRAVDKGYFKEEGLDVELVPVRQTPESIAQLAANQVQFAIVGPDPALFNAFERGIDMKVVAGAAMTLTDDGATGLVIRKDLIDSGAF